MILDSRYLMFMLPSFVLMMAVQWYVKSAYKRWSQVPTRSRMTGAEAAERLISANALNGVRIEGVEGNLTDHYDPGKKVLRLSREVYSGNSIAALAISAHELGHAMQDNEGYFPLRLRSLLVPAVNIGSNLGWILIMVGIVIQVTQVAWLGVLVFSGGAIFSLATLPVEFNASARARKMLTNTGLIMGPDEERGVKNVLNAAAMTYVAALITAVLQLLYWVTVVMGIGGRRKD